MGVVAVGGQGQGEGERWGPREMEEGGMMCSGAGFK